MSFASAMTGFIPEPLGHVAAEVADAARRRTQQEHE